MGDAPGQSNAVALAMSLTGQFRRQIRMLIFPRFFGS